LLGEKGGAFPDRGDALGRSHREYVTRLVALPPTASPAPTYNDGRKGDDVSSPGNLICCHTEGIRRVRLSRFLLSLVVVSRVHPGDFAPG
jgi:hypothetical protein